MKDIKKTQVVKLYPDQDKTVEQKIFIDSKEQWINVIHNGQELSMSIENFKNISNLATNAIQESVNH